MPLSDFREPPEPNDDYSRLPEALKQATSRREYLWLSDGEKARFQQNETEPEPES